MKEKEDQVNTEPLLICLGNEYREDDGLGLYIGRHEKVHKIPGVSIIENCGDGVAMINAWKNRRIVILVDAVNSGHQVGTIFHFDLLNTTLPESIFSTHHVSIPDCIALSKELGLLPGKLTFYGIEGNSFGQGLQLSAAVQEAADKVAEKIARELDRIH